MASLTNVFKEYIKHAEQGETITADALLKVSKLTVDAFKKYREQNLYGNAFVTIAKTLLTEDTFNRIKKDTERLIELAKQDPEFTEIEPENKDEVSN